MINLDLYINSQDKKKLVLISVLVIVFNILFTGIYFSLKNDLIKNKQAKLIEKAEQEKENLYNLFIENLEDLNTKAKNIISENSLEKLNYVELPENIVLVSQNRKVIASNNPAIPVNTDFSDGPYKISNLGQLLDRVITTLSPDISIYEYYPTQNFPTMFAAVPIIDSKNILKGFLVDEINIKNILKKFTENNKTNKIKLILSKVEHEKSKIIQYFSEDINYIKKIEENYSGLFKKILSEDSNSIVIKSYSENSLIAGWAYEPFTTWNVIAFENYNKVVDKLALLLVLIIILNITSLIIVFYWLKFILEYLLAKYKPEILENYILLIILIGCVLGAVLGIVFTSYKIYNLYNITYNSNENYTEIQLQNATKQIERNLFNTQFSTLFLAQEIKNLKLSDSQIQDRVKEILKKRSKYADSITIAYNNNSKLGAPTWAINSSGEITKYNLKDLYDYTKIEAQTMPEASWYNLALNNNQYWSLPYIHPFTKTKVITFAAKFKDGVIAYNYRTEELGKKLNAFLGETVGTSWIVDHNSNIIYEVKDSETTYLIDSTEQADIIKEAIKKEFGEKIIKDLKTKQDLYIWYEPISITNWDAIHIALKEQIRIPGISLRHLKMILLSLILLFFVSILALILYLYNLSPKTKKIVLSIASLAPLVSIFLILYNSRLDKYNQLLDTKKITSESKIIKYLDMAEQIASQNKLSKPIPVYIGIDIYSITISPEKDSVRLAAHLQQKYKKDYNPGIRIPQAKKLELRKIYETEKDNEITIGWDIYAEITQDLDNSKYPFDRPKLEIAIEPKSTTESYIFLPNLKIKKFVEQDYQVSDFSIKHSYYTYNQLPYSLNSHEDIQNSMGLTLEIQLQRNTTNPLMTDMIPLIIIFLTIFLIKLLGDSYLHSKTVMVPHDSLDIQFSIMAAYTALFFSVILMHPRLRGIVKSTNIIFIEYFFFFAYLAIFAFQLMILTPLFAKGKEKYISLKSTDFYWPILGLVSYIFTFITFYNP